MKRNFSLLLVIEIHITLILLYGLVRYSWYGPESISADILAWYVSASRTGATFISRKDHDEVVLFKAFKGFLLLLRDVRLRCFCLLKDGVNSSPDCVCPFHIEWSDCLFNLGDMII